MFSQIKWLQEKMKACLPRHLVSIKLLSRAAAEPSAGIDSGGKELAPPLCMCPAMAWSEKGEKDTVHLPSEPYN